MQWRAKTPEAGHPRFDLTPGTSGGAAVAAAAAAAALSGRPRTREEDRAMYGARSGASTEPPCSHNGNAYDPDYPPGSDHSALLAHGSHGAAAAERDYVTVRARRGGYEPFAFSKVNRLSTTVLYGRAGCLTTRNGCFRPGQSPARPARRKKGEEPRPLPV